MQPRSALFQRASGRPAPSSHTLESTQQLEKENDEVLKALREDVEALKGVSKRIGTEVKSHHVILDALQNSFDAARLGLKSTMKRLDKVSGASGNSHMWIIFVFAFVVFLFIFLLLKYR